MAHYSNFNDRPGSFPALPPQPPEFERLTARLGLVTEEQQKASGELKSWAERHRNVRFVPEELLKHWNIAVYLDQGRSSRFRE